MRNRMIAVIVVVIVFVGGVLALNRFAAANPSPAPTAMPAKAATKNAVSAEGVVLPAERAALAFKIGGRVAEILAREGDTMKADTVLARLDDSALKAQVAQAESAFRAAQRHLAHLQSANAAQIQIAEAQLARLKAGATREEIAIAQARVQQAATALAQAEDSYNRLRWIGGATEVQVRSARDTAGAAQRTAQMELERVKAGARAEEIAVAQAQLDLVRGEASQAEIQAAQSAVEQAKAALDLAKAMAQDALLLAPFDGTVTAVNLDLGQVVAPAMPVVIFGNLTKLQIETIDLSEEDIVQVAIGQKANIASDAFPDRIFRGEVVRVASVASDNRGDKVFKVTIELLESADMGLRWGMTVTVEILTNQ